MTENEQNEIDEAAPGADPVPPLILALAYIGLVAFWAFTAHNCDGDMCGLTALLVLGLTLPGSLLAHWMPDSLLLYVVAVAALVNAALIFFIARLIANRGGTIFIWCALVLLAIFALALARL